MSRSNHNKHTAARRVLNNTVQQTSDGKPFSLDKTTLAKDYKGDKKLGGFPGDDGWKDPFSFRLFSVSNNRMKDAAHRRARRRDKQRLHQDLMADFHDGLKFCSCGQVIEDYVAWCESCERERQEDAFDSHWDYEDWDYSPFDEDDGPEDGFYGPFDDDEGYDELDRHYDEETLEYIFLGIGGHPVKLSFKEANKRLLDCFTKFDQRKLHEVGTIYYAGAPWLIVVKRGSLV